MVRREAWRESDARRSVRHTTAMPVEFHCSTAAAKLDGHLNDIGQGGVGLVSTVALQPGEECRLQFPLLDYDATVNGRIVWCKPEADGFTVGVQFVEDRPYTHAQLVVDICHIEYYRRDQRQRLGRELDHASAIQEWRNRKNA